MAQEDNIFNGKRIKRDGKLVYINSGMQALFDEFVKGLEEGQEVTEFLSSTKDDGTNLQLAKAHVYIRKLATETGYTFEEMKLEVKRQAGLVHGDFVKSFAVCSKDELGLVFEAIKQICAVVGVPYD